MKIAFITLLALIVTLPAYAATTFEVDGAQERKTFIYTTTASQTVTIDDSADDLFVFDRQNRNAVPPVLADLTNMTISPEESGWRVTLEIAEPLPEDPALAVNFDIFIDADGDRANNATNGVYRSDSDTIFMVLHGTRTKWHSKWWKYNVSTGRWVEQPDKPLYEIGEGVYSIQIPYDVISNEPGVKMRGFSLTSSEGITAIDVIPGDGLPTVLPSKEPAPVTPAESRAPEKPTQKTNSGAIMLILVLAGIVLIARKGKTN